MMNLLKNEAVRRTVRTFLQAFLGLLLPGALGWLHDLTEWAKGQGQTPFPDAHSLAYLGVAAIGAGFVAVITALMTGLENGLGVGFLRDVPPKDNPGAAGTVTTRTIAIAAFMVAVVVLLYLLL